MLHCTDNYEPEQGCTGCGNLFPRTELIIEYGIKRTAHAQTAKPLRFCSECVIDFREDLNEDYKQPLKKQKYEEKAI